VPHSRAAPVKEFDTAVRVGFGHDGEGGDTAADFATVRGDYASNKFVQQLQSEITSRQHA
jgi:hypothetical protein